VTSTTSVSERAPRSAHDTYDHLTPLLYEFAALPPSDRRRRALRDELATGYLPVVQHIARRYRNRGEPIDDLEQVGAVGLLGALERFDPSHGVGFLSFAVPTITGEIRRHFRDRTWAMRVPRRLKDLQGPMGEAVGVLTTSLGRAPRPTEIAAHLDVPVAEIVDALAAQQAHTPDSLDAFTPAGDAAHQLGTVDTALASAEYRHELRAALAELPDRERAIVVLRFFGDLTQSQIAERFGLSQMHVSRLLGQTLARLRARIDAA
jgi:RNA polymerase sigma-B factor